jgi:hypothetical protein
VLALFRAVLGTRGAIKGGCLVAVMHYMQYRVAFIAIDDTC